VTDPPDRPYKGFPDICPYDDDDDDDDGVTAMATVAVIDKEAVFDSLCVTPQCPRLFAQFSPAFHRQIPIFTHMGNADEFLKG